MERKNNFIVTNINSESFELGRDVLVEQIKYIISCSKENDSRIIFVVSSLKEATRILNYLFVLWKEQNNNYKLSALNHLKKIFKRTSFQLGVEKEVSIELEKYFQQINRLLNKKINLDLDPVSQTRDQAQLLAYGDIISALIFFYFIKENFPEILCFLEDSAKFMKTDIGPGDSHVGVQPAIEDSNRNMITFFHLNGGDKKIFIFPDLIVGTDNGDYAIKCPNCVISVALYASACSYLGQVELIYW